MGKRENRRAQGRHARGEGASSPLACLLLAHPFFSCPLLLSACYAGYTLLAKIKLKEIIITYTYMIKKRKVEKGKD